MSNDELTLYVYDRDFRIVGIVEEYESLVWYDRFDSVGEFEITIRYDQYIRDLLQEGRFVTIDFTDHFAVIESIEVETDEDGAVKLEVSGPSIECILDRRIIVDKLSFGSDDRPENLQNAIKKILDDNVISPSDTKRLIKHFVFKMNYDERLTALTIIDETFDKKSVLDSIKGLCSDNHIGFKLVIDDKMRFVFSLYIGQDLSDHILFSPYNDTLNDSRYSFNAEKYKNVAYVSENYERCIDVTNLDVMPIGLDRYEVHFDGSDLKDNKSAELEEAEYRTFAVDKLNLDHKKTSLFDGTIQSGALYEYKKDYDLGDKVCLENEYGDSATVYISEVVITYDENGMTIIPTFEEIDWDWDQKKEETTDDTN